MMRRYLLIFWLAGLIGCKGPEDRLTDIGRSLGPSWDLDETLYDSGQLVHEGFAGLIRSEELSVDQVGRGLYYAAQVVERTGVPLLRSDAVAFMAHMSERVPLAPRSDPLVEDPTVNKSAREFAERLLQATDPLAVGRIHIPSLDNPDRVLVEETLAELRRITGKDLGRSAETWRKWWEAERGGLIDRAVLDAREPLRGLSGLRYPNLGSARAILGLLAITVNAYDVPALRDDLRDATMSLSRQVVELGIAKALEDQDDAGVRSAGARAARQVHALTFGPLIGRRLVRESDSGVKALLIPAAAYYPTKEVVRGLIRCLEDPERAVQLQAREVLVALTSVDQGFTVDSWALWWQREGQDRWR